MGSGIKSNQVDEIPPELKKLEGKYIQFIERNPESDKGYIFVIGDGEAYLEIGFPEHFGEITLNGEEV